MKFLALRIDDIGASTKEFEVYSNKLRGVGNFLFLKYLPYFRSWGVYREMSVRDWDGLFNFLRVKSLGLTIAVTASWVEKNGKMTPFPKKFPEQAKILKEAMKKGLCEIANHGLTHCLAGKHLPRLFSSNRQFHREFYPYLPEDIHREHIIRSQAILQDYFQEDIVTFTPPGNLWSQTTEKLCAEHGLKIISSERNEKNEYRNGLFFPSCENTIAFHDRDIVLNSLKFMETIINRNPDVSFVNIKEMAKNLNNSLKTNVN